jgi:Holliday junction resolvase RusA-like endonuclease
MSEISFTIPGVLVGKGRPKFARRGNFVTAYTPEKTASYENLVKLYAAEAMKGRDLITGPVDVRMLLFVTPPASWSQKKRISALNGVIFPTSKPDLDNSAKLALDACNEIVWKDDKQVVDLVVRKRYSETARAMVHVTEL